MIIRTIVPIILLIAIGFASRHFHIFKSGDEKIFSSYVFFLALPALFFVNMSELLMSRQVLSYMVATAIPPVAVVLFYLLLSFVFRLKKEQFYFLVFSTVFGSYAFFGIPFMLFAFPGIAAERLSVLSSASISVTGVFMTILVLELYKIGSASFLSAAKTLTVKFSKNPLILSILLGLAFSLIRIRLPIFLSSSLHMLGGTTATVSLFMLGLFLYGRKYKGLLKALILSIVRAVIMPAAAIASMFYFGITGLPATVSVLMAAMPVAISMIVLSERYDFYKETTASLTLISTLGAIIYLPLWILFLGTR
ncbi:MAG: AEC family transporter [Candidatus Margulisiibacteriota bacterium]